METLCWPSRSRCSSAATAAGLLATACTIHLAADRVGARRAQQRELRDHGIVGDGKVFGGERLRPHAAGELLQLIEPD